MYPENELNFPNAATPYFRTEVGRWYGGNGLLLENGWFCTTAYLIGCSGPLNGRRRPLSGCPYFGIYPK